MSSRTVCSILPFQYLFNIIMFAPRHSEVVKEMSAYLTYAFPPQATPSELALKLPGRAMHIRALCGGLKSVRSSLMYVKNMLDDIGTSSHWGYVQDTVASELTTASMFLGGILDGCVIAELPPGQAPNRTMSFFGTHFRDTELHDIQEKVIELRSSNLEDQTVYMNLSTLINFWKHYLPYQPLQPPQNPPSYRDQETSLSNKKTLSPYYHHSHH